MHFQQLPSRCSLAQEPHFENHAGSKKRPWWSGRQGVASGVSLLLFIKHSGQHFTVCKINPRLISRLKSLLP